MAVTALDHPTKDAPADTYFAGRELLAMSLRSEGGTEKSRFRIVARVVAELVELGAIERIDGGRTGHNAVYLLTLGDLEKPEKKPRKKNKKGGQSSHPQGGQISPPQGGQFDLPRVADLATPRNQEEPIEELEEEEGVEVTPTSHPPRARAKPTPSRCPDHHIPLKPRTDDLDACGFCRRGVPPFAAEVAPVIPITSRRPA